MIVTKHLEQENGKHQIKKSQEEHMDLVLKKNEQTIPAPHKLFAVVTMPLNEERNGQPV